MTCYDIADMAGMTCYDIIDMTGRTCYDTANIAGIGIMTSQIWLA